MCALSAKIVRKISGVHVARRSERAQQLQRYPTLVRCLHGEGFPCIARLRYVQTLEPVSQERELLAVERELGRHESKPQ